MVKSKSNLKIILTVIMSVIMIFISLPVSAAAYTDYNDVPVPDYVYDYIVATRQVDLKGSQNNFTDERFFDFPTYSFGFRNMMINPLDITAGKYIEFDFYSDRAGTVWMSLGSAHMQFEFYDNRSLHKSFTVNAGWNHIVLTTDGEYREADSTTFKTYNPEVVTGFILHSVDAGYVRLTNVALTSDEVSQGNNDAPVPDYVYEDIVATRQVDLKGTQNNFTDERFFDFPTYANGFYDMMTNPLDITAAKYLEFDFYSDKAGTVWMSLGSAHMHFEFYDNRSLHKSFTVNAGWNHVVLTTDGEYREADSTTFMTYNPEMVTGFILHSVDAGYVRLTNVALTSDEVSQGNNDVPVPDYVYEDIVATRQVDLKGTQNNFTDERFFDFPTYANGFYDMMTNPLDITAAEYIEFDFYSDKAGTVWMSLGSAHMHFEFYDNRSLHKSFTVNEGWNHIVLTTDGEYREADSTTFETYNPEMVTGFILHSVDAGYVRLTNVALTSYIPQGYNDVPVPDYVYEDIVATRQVDLKGSQNNFTDERFFDYPTYAFAFRYMMLDPFDITAAKYLEFDFYSDKAGTVWMSLGSAEFPFEFYDNRSLHKSFTVNAGWNHIVLTTDGEYREADSTTLETYNPEMVTGFILHSVDAGYVRLTNVALTYSVSQGDTVLNYRSDFDLGAVMHAPQWSTSYREENLELQIKQLKEMGGSLLRVDAVDNFPHLDKTVKLCNAYGIKVMLIVYLPGRTFDPTVQVDLDAIREYYRMYATRYDGKHGCGKIDYIQIDNEMDVAIMGLFEMCGTGSEISEYPEPSLRKITEQVKAASLGIADANTDIKRVLNIAWVHYGILKYFQQEGVEWDVTGHDWYQDMFDYGNDPSDCYNSGQELYDLFKKPIIICETNMWMNYYYNYDNGTIDPDYKKSSWWDPLVEAIKDYYDKDFVIGCTVYEFYDEPNNFGGGGHFGINEVNADGSFKSHKPIYFILQQMFEGKSVEQENWQEVEREYSVREDTDMRSLIAIKNALLEDNGIYKSEYDLEIDGRVDSRDYAFLRKYLFENL